MTRLILPVFCVITVFLAACGQGQDADSAPENTNETYYNQKFRFEVEYPADVLIGQGESPNGYGQIYDSKDKEAILKTYAKFNTSDVPFETAYEKAQNGKVTEKDIDERASVFTVSGVHSGMVYHIKTYFIDDVYIIYEFRYPETKSDVYGPINKEMMESFRAL